MWVRRKDFERLKHECEKLVSLIDQAKDKPYLIDIQRASRMNKFTFVRNGKVHQIETMGLMSDDLDAWREMLLR